jgi:hypothetical protein
MQRQFSRLFSSPSRQLDCDERKELERTLRSASLAYSRCKRRVFVVKERALKLHASNLADEAKRIYQLARITLKQHRRLHGC